MFYNRYIKVWFYIFWKDSKNVEKLMIDMWYIIYNCDNLVKYLLNWDLDNIY